MTVVDYELDAFVLWWNYMDREKMIRPTLITAEQRCVNGHEKTKKVPSVKLLVQNNSFFRFSMTNCIMYLCPHSNWSEAQYQSVSEGLGSQT